MLLKKNKYRIIIGIVTFIFIYSYIFPSISYAISQNALNSILNNTFFFDPNATVCNMNGSSISSSTNASLSALNGSNTRMAFQFFRTQGLSNIAAAALVGNFAEESGGVVPSRLQIGGGAGHGIAQWGGSRWQGVVTLASQLGLSPFSMKPQLAFVWQELTTGYTSVLQSLKTTTSLSSAVQNVMTNYEKPFAPQDHFNVRLSDATNILKQYGNGSFISSTGSSSSCPSSSTPINCTLSNTSSTANNISQIRQKVVCIAQAELALWKSQPNYPAPTAMTDPNFTYAQSGYLKYSQNQKQEWCADFVSWVYNQANDPLAPAPNWRIPAVSGLQSAAQNSSNFTWHPINSGYTPQPGDIAIHGANHANIFISSTNGVNTYIGGDQGPFPAPGGTIVSIDNQTNDITGYISPN